MFKLLKCILVGFLIMTAGCAGTNYYTKDKVPSIRYLHKSRVGNMTYFLWFAVSNPTSVRKHFRVECTLVEPACPMCPFFDVVLKKSVIVAPRSDVKFSLSTQILGNYQCLLFPEKITS